MKSLVRRVAGSIVRVLPEGAPEYIYRVLLRPRPLRALANRALRVLVPASIALPEGTLYLNQKDPVVSGALALGAYEPYETELFRQAIRPGMTVVDIGANLGLHAVIAARRAGTAGYVIAFEPEPENYALLAKNIAANGFKNVTLSQSAIADVSGTMTLHLFDSNKGRHSLVPLTEGSREAAGALEVPVETLDDALARRAIARVDLIKMDIEGAEPLALRGMKKALALPGLTLFMEYSPEAARRAGSDPVALLEELAGYGFSLSEIREAGRMLMPVTDFTTFSKRFSGEEYANLLCSKGPFPANASGE